jgi:hypothetical protein
MSSSFSGLILSARGGAVFSMGLNRLRVVKTFWVKRSKREEVISVQ